MAVVAVQVEIGIHRAGDVEAAAIPSKSGHRNSLTKVNVCTVDVIICGITK